jgi:predicted metal-dependent hydrolase
VARRDNRIAAVPALCLTARPGDHEQRRNGTRSVRRARLSPAPHLKSRTPPSLAFGLDPASGRANLPRVLTRPDDPPNPTPTSQSEWLEVGSHRIPIHFVRVNRARRYILRLRHDGSAQVTVPRRGSVVEAHRFAQRNSAWLERQLLRPVVVPPPVPPWRIGSELLFRGELVWIESVSDDDPGLVRFGTETLRTPVGMEDLRPLIERHLWALAASELPPHVHAHAVAHGLRVRRVTVRNQRSRWGSSSRRGTISLNWRLIQTPRFVSEYIILHELMHQKEMNHSDRFWHAVQQVCPDYHLAEIWLQQHTRLLH